MRGWTNEEVKSRVGQEFVIGVGRGYLEDILDNTTLTNKGEEVNELECCSESVKDEAKVED